MKRKVSLDEQLKERYEAWERIYKQAGNAIVKAVLIALFKQML